MNKYFLIFEIKKIIIINKNKFLDKICIYLKYNLIIFLFKINNFVLIFILIKLFFKFFFFSFI